MPPGEVPVCLGWGSCEGRSGLSVRVGEGGTVAVRGLLCTGRHMGTCWALGLRLAFE